MIRQAAQFASGTLSRFVFYFHISFLNNGVRMLYTERALLLIDNLSNLNRI